MSRPNRAEFVAALRRAFQAFVGAVGDLTLPVEARFWTEANRIERLLRRDAGEAA